MLKLSWDFKLMSVAPSSPPSTRTLKFLINCLVLRISWMTWSHSTNVTQLKLRRMNVPTKKKSNALQRRLNANTTKPSGPEMPVEQKTSQRLKRRRKRVQWSMTSTFKRSCARSSKTQTTSLKCLLRMQMTLWASLKIWRKKTCSWFNRVKRTNSKSKRKRENSLLRRRRLRPSSATLRIVSVKCKQEPIRPCKSFRIWRPKRLMRPARPSLPKPTKKFTKRVRTFSNALNRRKRSKMHHLLQCFWRSKPESSKQTLTLQITCTTIKSTSFRKFSWWRRTSSTKRPTKN